MKKKAAAPEAAGESAPAWIVSFADLVTLMMSFFVVLYALKQGGEKQQMDTMAAIKLAFMPDYQPPPDSPSAWQEAVWRAKGKHGPPLANFGGHAPDPTNGARGDSRTVQTIRANTQVVTGGIISFDFNQSELDEASKEQIKEIAKLLVGHRNVVEIKGHVSPDEAAENSKDPYGTVLAFERAMAVVEELVRCKVDRAVLLPESASIYQLVNPSAFDQATQKQNRRVEIFVTEKLATEYSPVPTVPATTRMGAQPIHD